MGSFPDHGTEARGGTFRRREVIDVPFADGFPIFEVNSRKGFGIARVPIGGDDSKVEALPEMSNGVGKGADGAAILESWEVVLGQNQNCRTRYRVPPPAIVGLRIAERLALRNRKMRNEHAREC